MKKMVPDPEEQHLIDLQLENFKNKK